MNMVIFACFAVVCMLCLSIYISRPNWPYHPGAAKGYVTDTLIYLLVPLAPMVICLGGFQIVRQFVAIDESNTTSYVVITIAMVGLFGARRLPFVLEAQKRVVAARNARYQASGPQS